MTTGTWQGKAVSLGAGPFHSRQDSSLFLYLATRNATTRPEAAGIRSLDAKCSPRFFFPASIVSWVS